MPGFLRDPTVMTTLPLGVALWSTVDNAKLSDDAYATATPGAFETEHLVAKGFGFTIGASEAITGIRVEFERKAAAAATGLDFSVRLLKGGVVQGDNRASLSNWPTADAYAMYPADGGNSDLWGLTWTPADINDPNFGVAISGKGDTTLSVDHIRITVFTDGGQTNGQPVGQYQLGSGVRGIVVRPDDRFLSEE